MPAKEVSLLPPIRNDEITLVFQGEAHPCLERNVARSRAVLPGVKIVVSTLDVGGGSLKRFDLDVDFIVSDDPGALPPYKKGKRAPVNNVNRQIATSRAGLARVKSRYAVKIRTDCELSSRAFVDIYSRVAERVPNPNRLLTSSIYTLHPDGIEAFPFHLSDWFFFGPTELLRTYYDVPFMTGEDAVWFNAERPHTKGSNYFARRYCARFSPEQYLTIEFAKKIGGYVTPSFLNDSSERIKSEYQRFLSKECIVCEPDDLGLRFDKYAHASRSNYQFFNCVWGSDWEKMRERFEEVVAASKTSRELLTPSRPGPDAGRRRAAVRAMRRIDLILPLLGTAGLMPLVGDVLGFYRKLEGLTSDA
ncbi:WavE lipopolysaccharide synthesis family protein [Paraburkholderia metrosideri]|uniref:WavE lipopolysaccharide synthesis family protein n=1 Tax=Paraburkholderia metrosideri TaxID=580937 RepID=A0ABW9DYZ4_9BURK